MPLTLPLKALSILVPVLALTACATPGPATIEGECRIFGPLTSSVQDTAVTRKGIVIHNAKGRAACGWKPPS